MDPSKELIPRKLLLNLDLPTSRICEYIEFDPAKMGMLTKNPNNFLDLLSSTTQQARIITERYGKESPITYEPNAIMGLIYGVQASTQALALALVGVNSQPEDQNARALFFDTQLLTFQSCKRYITARSAENNV